MKTTSNVTAVIPARYGSSRFPGKPLTPICGKPMIEWVYKRAKAAQKISRVLVATDDTRIKNAVEAFGGEAVMTSEHHPSGTDRIAEAVQSIESDLIINLQGDEPMLSPEIIDRLIDTMLDDPSEPEMGTAAVKFSRNSEDLLNPNIVKVVISLQGKALYFSRAGIPFQRDADTPAPVALRHWGIYAYRPGFLKQFITWEPSSLEECEKLEQLRALENGATIKVILADKPSFDVNVPEDVQIVEKMLKQRGEA